MPTWFFLCSTVFKPARLRMTSCDLQSNCNSMVWRVGRLGARFVVWPSCSRHGYPDWLRPAGRQQLKMLEPDDWWTSETID